MKSFRQLPDMRLWEDVKSYFYSSSIQGLKYITYESHWTKRLFWVVACFISTLGMTTLIRSSYRTYLENPVSFLVSRDKLEWNTSFPSASICETDADLGGVAIPATRIFGDDHHLDLETFLKDIVYYDGKCYACDHLCDVTINCTKNFLNLIDQVRQPCNGLFSGCWWLGEEFDCCTHFKPLITETGPCFTLNSLQAESGEDKNKFVVNRYTGPGMLRVIVKTDVNLYLHNTEDVPFLNIPQAEKTFIIKGTQYRMSFSVTEIENDPMLYKIPIDKRKCRFPGENIIEAYKYYSYSACVVDCRARAQLHYCNCTHHYMPKIAGAQLCDIDGLSCLAKDSKVIGSLRTKDSTKPGLVCPCIASCTENDYNIIESTFSGSGNESYTIIEVSMKTLPDTRFKRYIVRSSLDLVVSIGGTAGLFLGVSILSLAEFVYFVLFRFQWTGYWKRKDYNRARPKIKKAKKNNIISKKVYKRKVITYLP